MQILHDFRIIARRTGEAKAGLEALRAQGIGGIVTNMPFEDYMQSAETWQQFQAFLRACRELGMRVWIYDEKGYPSAFAGGMVLAGRPDLEATGLYRDAQTGQISVQRSYEGTHNCNNYYMRARTPNLLEPEAAAEFVRVTHERYAKELGADLSIVEAFFTDEPALNVLYLPPIPAAQGIPVMDEPDPDRTLLPGVPWAKWLGEHYGRTDLAGLFLDQNESGLLRRDFYERVGVALAEKWFGSIQAWCKDHGVLSSGHLLAEEDSAIHVPLYGNPLRCMMRLDIPGIDVLSAVPKNSYHYCRRGAVLASSAAMLNGTRRVFTESSDFLQIQNEKRAASPAEATASLAWQAALGVTEFTYYFAFGVCPELSEHAFDFLPPEQSRISRTPKDFLAINEAITALVERLAPASLAADVFLYYPCELLQAAYHPVVRQFDTETRPPELVRIANAYHAALDGLLNAGIIPCLVDGQMLREMRRTDGCGGRYAVHKAQANAIVFPAGCEPPQDCRPETPHELLSMSDDLPARLFGNGQARILKDNPDICVGVMKRDGKNIVTLVNLTDRDQSCHLRFRGGREIQASLAAYQFTTHEHPD